MKLKKHIYIVYVTELIPFIKQIFSFIYNLLFSAKKNYVGLFIQYTNLFIFSTYPPFKLNAFDTTGPSSTLTLTQRYSFLSVRVGMNWRKLSTNVKLH